MAKDVLNRSSEGVRAQLYPRTDFPQNGWLSFSARDTLVTQDFVKDHSSFVPCDARLSGKKRLFYSDAVQQWWTAFQPKIASDIAIEDWQQPSFYPLPHKSRVQFQWPDDGTSNDVFSITTPLDPSQQDWYIDTVQTGAGKPYLRDFPVDNAWQDAVLDPSTNPALSAWGINPTRPQHKKQFVVDQVDLGWISSTFASPFDPSSSSWSDDSGLPVAKRRSDGWLDAIRGNNQNFGLLDTRLTEPVYDQLAKSFRTKTNRKPIPSNTLIDGWQSVYIPTPFDAQYSPHSLDQRTRDRYKRTPQLDTVAPAWEWYSVNPVVTGSGTLLVGAATITGTGTVTGAGTPGGGRRRSIQLDPEPIWHRH